MSRGLTIEEWLRWHKRESSDDPADAITPINTLLRLKPDAAERYEEVRAAMLERDPEYRMSGSVRQSMSDQVYRCRSNGSRRGGFGVSRD